MVVGANLTVFQIMSKHQNELLANWLEDIKSSTNTRTMALLTEEELYSQARDLLATLTTAVEFEQYMDIGALEFAASVTMLRNISASRALHGFTPTETATFVFSIKNALFRFLQIELGGNPESLYTEVVNMNHLIDKLGIITFEAYTLTREELISIGLEKLEKANRELKHSNEKLDDFSFIAAHDLREPLRGIHSQASFLLEDHSDRLDEDGIKRLHRITYLSGRTDKLVNDLLYISRLGREKAAIAPTDLNSLIADLKCSLEETLDDQNVAVHIPKTLPIVRCDWVRVTEVFRNLISNSIKYNDNAEKRIEISFTNPCGQSEDGYVFHVKDNGIGIAEEFHKDIFRIFRRLHTEKKYGGGTGSGLAFVNSIVEHHGGRIWVESQPGNGACFYFTLEGNV